MDLNNAWRRMSARVLNVENQNCTFTWTFWLKGVDRTRVAEAGGNVALNALVLP